MSKALRPRRLTALVAAYTIALQALLLPLSVAAGLPDGSLCASSASSHAGTVHTTGCPCAAGCGMQCCAGSLIGAPQADAVFGVMRASVPASMPQAAASAAGPCLHSPHLARAPPAV